MLLLLSLLPPPAAPATRSASSRKLQAYEASAARCANATGLTLLVFADDGGAAPPGQPRSGAASAAARFESELRARGEASGLRPLPRIGGLVANLSNVSLALALADATVLSAEADCVVSLPEHEEAAEAPRRRLGVQSSPPSWGLDRLDERSLPLDNEYDYGQYDGAGVRVYGARRSLLATSDHPPTLGLSHSLPLAHAQCSTRACA